MFKNITLPSKAKYISIFIFILVIIIVSTNTYFAYTKLETQLEEQYYRGIYDVCIKAIQQKDECLNSIPKFKLHRWYEQESPGWKWPVRNTLEQTG